MEHLANVGAMEKLLIGALPLGTTFKFAAITSRLLALLLVDNKFASPKITRKQLVQFSALVPSTTLRTLNNAATTHLPETTVPVLFKTHW